MKSEYLAEVKVVMIPNYAIGLMYLINYRFGVLSLRDQKE